MPFHDHLRLLACSMPFQPGVTIAIPICQGRISPVLDTAGRLLLVSRRHGREIARKDYTLTPLSTEALASCLAELHVDVLICASLSESLWSALERLGVRVRPHLCGEVEEILKAFGRGKLRREEFRMPGCWGWHLHNQYCRPEPSPRSGKSIAAEEPKQVEE